MVEYANWTNWYFRKILHIINTLVSGPTSSLLLLGLEKLASELGKHLFLLESHEGWHNNLLSQSFSRISIAIWIRYVSMFSGTNILMSLILFNSVKRWKKKDLKIKYTEHLRKPMSWKWWNILGGQRKCSSFQCHQSYRTETGWNVSLTPAPPTPFTYKIQNQVSVMDAA